MEPFAKKVKDFVSYYLFLQKIDIWQDLEFVYLIFDFYKYSLCLRNSHQI